MGRRHVTELLPLYLNGTLAERQRAEVAAHLQGCPACQRELCLWQSVQEAMIQEAQEWTRQAVPPVANLLGRVTVQGVGEDRAATGRRAGRRTGRAFADPAAGAWLAAWQLLRRAALLVASQARVVPRVVWLSTPALLAAGALAQAVAGDLRAAQRLVELLAPVVVAIAVVTAADAPGVSQMELIGATPTSPRLLLWASLTGQLSYHAAVLMVGGWLISPTAAAWDVTFFARQIMAPTAAASAAALLVSMLAGNAAGTATACVLELTFLASRSGPPQIWMGLPALGPVLAAWGSSTALWAVSAALFTAAFGLVESPWRRRALSTH